MDDPDMLVKHAIIGISDDVKHDESGVKEFIKAALFRLVEQGLTINSTDEWTDVCVAQFEDKYAFLDISEKTIPCVRNYFVTSHGKKSL